MKTTKSLLEWKISLAETLAFGLSLVTLTLWTMATFVEKTSAREFEALVDKRFDAQLVKEVRLEGKIDKIEDDVSVIRGIIEGQRRRDREKND